MIIELRLDYHYADSAIMVYMPDCFHLFVLIDTMVGMPDMYSISSTRLEDL